MTGEPLSRTPAKFGGGQPGAMADGFTARVVAIIRSIPAGRVTTYGMIAAGAGNRRGARQVARILHSCSEKYRLPCHRVVNRYGEISVRSSMGYFLQRGLLAEEGVLIGADGRIDLTKFLWQPGEERQESGPGS